MDVDHNIIYKLTGSLNEILQLELTAGNVIAELMREIGLIQIL